MDDKEAVARAYYRVRRTGALDYPAWCAAVDAYCARHPEVSKRDAGLVVARLIAEAAAYRTSPGGGPLQRGERYWPGAIGAD